ncbi:hypothetical protein HanRHA438_Chr09g0403411 [Helianthus annuus]|nr:hypothetical protein HanHA300_Chr09g0321471 [Helianthus annuus]KAJ0534689.1 hypothetical protein HanIR_Chr09g0422521 [Helianthus annuus]KAJ0707737.1 hypothetical protein HanLR1_Chr09g0321751 [Helianthus annuus]KAJ0711717.1 hypothetical protein HanOQP8_Chr09g0326911 [Helianthus annuus]KAJ0799261.1 hypothetical protein HanOQP8_Chr00c765g0854391 [Helianthus annuus]
MYYYKLHHVMLLILLSLELSVLVDKVDSWFLESYWKNAGQAATSVAHIKERAARDEEALLVFSGRGDA